MTPMLPKMRTEPAIRTRTFRRKTGMKMPDRRQGRMRKMQEIPELQETQRVRGNRTTARQKQIKKQQKACRSHDRQHEKKGGAKR